MQTKNNLELLYSHHLALTLLTTGSHWRFKNHINIKLAFWITFFSSISWIKLWIEYFGLIFEWIFDWMNISNLVLNWILNWIIFGPDSTFEWITKTNWTALARAKGGRCLREVFLLVFGNLCLTHSAIPLFYRLSLNILELHNFE